MTENERTARPDLADHDGLAEPAFPKAGDAGPNLATLDRLRGLRRPRLLPPSARRHALPRECAAC